MNSFVISTLLLFGLSVLGGLAFVFVRSIAAVGAGWRSGEFSPFKVARILIVYAILLALGSASVWVAVRAILVKASIIN